MQEREGKLLPGAVVVSARFFFGFRKLKRVYITGIMRRSLKISPSRLKSCTNLPAAWFYSGLARISFLGAGIFSLPRNLGGDFNHMDAAAAVDDVGSVDGGGGCDASRGEGTKFQRRPLLLYSSGHHTQLVTMWVAAGSEGEEEERDVCVCGLARFHSLHAAVTLQFCLHDDDSGKTDQGGA